jgi:hypothetical protein
MNQTTERLTETDINVDAQLQALEAELAPKITGALKPVPANMGFKMDLEEELIARAKRRAERNHLIRTFGLIGGGLLTVVAGIVGFILLKRQNHEEDEMGGSPDQSPRPATPATATVS